MTADYPPASGPSTGGDFIGAKGALFIGRRLVVQLRDDFPWIDWPGHWDLPGGGREGGESPEQCWARETEEELGLDLGRATWLWRRAQPSWRRPERLVWFFAAVLPEGSERGIRFSHEGQGWALVVPRLYFALPRTVPHHADELRAFLASPESAAVRS